MPLWTLLLLAVPATEPNLDALRAAHRGPGTFRYSADAETGKLISVVGSWDIGLHDSALKAPAAEVASSVQSFVQESNIAFAVSSEWDPSSLVLQRVRPINSDLDVAEFRQECGGLHRFDSEVTAGFRSNGFLQSINGVVRDTDCDRSAADAALSIDQVVSVARQETAIDGGVFALGDDGVWTNGQGTTAERGYDDDVVGIAWSVSTPTHRLRIDEKTGAIYRVQPRQRNAYYRTCDLTLMDFNHDTSGYSTSIELQNGTLPAGAQCEGDYDLFSARYYWQLRYEASGTNHQLGRVDDAINPEAEEFTTTVPTGSIPFDSSATYRRQHTFYYLAKSMRSTIQNNCFNAASPANDDNIKIYMNATSSGCLDPPGGGSIQSCWNDVSTNITMEDALGNRPSVLAHEYGHGVVHEYGDESNTCTTTDRGDAIDETFADIFAELAIADSDNWLKPSYATGMIMGTWGNIAGGFQRHVSSAIQFDPAGSCANDNEVHAFGHAYEVANWELLWNRDCNLYTCTSSTKTFANQVFLGKTQAQVISLLGDGWGTAMDVTGQNTDFVTILAQFEDRMETVDPTDTARIFAVFNHHNL